MKKFRKSKLNCYDVINQILQFSLSLYVVTMTSHFDWKIPRYHISQTIVLKATTILDPKHCNPIKSTE